jgi:hypothetical protein
MVEKAMNSVTAYKQNLLLNCHPYFVKISMTVDSKARQASDIIFLSSSFRSKAPNLIKCVALKRICKQGCGFTLSKISAQPHGPTNSTYTYKY